MVEGKAEKGEGAKWGIQGEALFHHQSTARDRSGVIGLESGHTRALRAALGETVGRGNFCATGLHRNEETLKESAEA